MSIPMDERARQRQFEDQFLAQLRARAMGLVRGKLPADRAQWEEMSNRADAVRADLTRVRGDIDRRALFDQLPGTRDVLVRFQKSLVGGLLRPTVARMRAAVLVNVEELATERTPSPVSREQVLDALARYELLPSGQRPSAVVFASPTGFSPAARGLVNQRGGPSLILMGGRADGGWDVELPQTLQKSPWAKLFEFESQDEQLKRLFFHLEQTAATVDTSGLAIPALAEKLGLSVPQTEALVRRACRVQSRLMTVEHNGVLHISRTPLIEEGRTMSMWSRIRRLLRLPPTPAERVRELTTQRIRIEQQRHEVDQKLNSLEADERTLLERGVSAGSDAEKRQIAGRLARTRQELGRVRTQANVYTQQITVIGTQIHHLTLKEQVRRTPLPKPEELTREAAETETAISELAVSADLAGSIEVGATTPLMAQQEDDILAEFDKIKADRAAGSAGSQAGAAQQAATGSAASAPAASGAQYSGPARTPEPSRGADGGRGGSGKSPTPARPEMG